MKFYNSQQPGHVRTNCPNRALFIEGSDPYPQEGEEFQEQSPQEEVYNIDQEVEDEDDSLACIQVIRKLFFSAF